MWGKPQHMTYTFTNKHGDTRSFEDQKQFCLALENQVRVERLQELNRELVYEESLYGEPVIFIDGRPTDLTTAIELELDTEQR